MTDTIRTVSALQTLLRDGQASGTITPQIVRDMLVSLDANLKVVADNTARLALYPSPTGNERVFNLTSGNLERYSASLGAWVVDVVTPATPELYGAQGDGTTDDSAALLSAIATGKNVSLSFGKTYLVSKPLVLSAEPVAVRQRRDDQAGQPGHDYYNRYAHLRCYQLDYGGGGNGCQFPGRSGDLWHQRGELTPEP